MDKTYQKLSPTSHLVAWSILMLNHNKLKHLEGLALNLRCTPQRHHAPTRVDCEGPFIAFIFLFVFLVWQLQRHFNHVSDFLALLPSHREQAPYSIMFFFFFFGSAPSQQLKNWVRYRGWPVLTLQMPENIIHICEVCFALGSINKSGLSELFIYSSGLNCISGFVS